MIELKQANKLEYILATFFLCSDLVDTFLDSIGIPGTLFYLITALMIFIHFLKNVIWLNISAIGYYALVSTLLVIGISNNREYITDSRIYCIIFYFLPAFYLFRYIDVKIWMRAFKTYSYIALIYFLPQVFIADMETYYMDFAYSILLPLCFITYKYFIDKKLVDFAFVLISTACLFIFGCRGALIGFGLFVTYMLIINRNIRYRGIIIAVCISVVILTFYNLEQILDLLKTNGFNSRTIEKMLTGSFSKIGAREEFYSVAERIIENHPEGLGVLGSRYNLRPFPHSLYYEMLIDFGVVIGSIILLYIAYILIFDLIYVKDEEYRALISIIGICGITRLMLSSSIYHQMYIPALIALHYAAYELRKQRRMKMNKGELGNEHSEIACQEKENDS